MNREKQTRKTKKYSSFEIEKPFRLSFLSVHKQRRRGTFKDYMTKQD